MMRQQQPPIRQYEGEIKSLNKIYCTSTEVNSHGSGIFASQADFIDSSDDSILARINFDLAEADELHQICEKKIQHYQRVKKEIEALAFLLEAIRANAVQDEVYDGN